MTTKKEHIDEIKRFREDNLKKRLEFIDFYVEWLKRTDNKTWSKAQKELID